MPNSEEVHVIHVQQKTYITLTENCIKTIAEYF